MEHYRFAGPAWVIGAPERILGKGPGLPIETAYYKLVFPVTGKAGLTAVISASSRYSLYVNGSIVTHGPVKGDRTQHYCDELDLSGFLREGPNVIAVKVVSFPPQEAFQGESGNYTNRGPYSVIGTASGPCLLFIGTCTGVAGEKLDLSTGYADWLVQNDTAISWLNQSGALVFCHEEVDGHRLPPGWETDAEIGPGFVPAVKRWFYDDAHFDPLSPLPLFKRPIPRLFEEPRKLTREMPAEAAGTTRFTFSPDQGDHPVTLKSRGHYRLDLDAGELTTGYVSIETEGGAGAVITLTYAESYGGPWVGTIKGIRSDWKNFDLGGFQDRFYPSGGRHHYEFFWFRTFRFVRLEIETGDSVLTLRPIRYRETGYPLNCETTIAPSASWVSRLWELSVRTLRRCMHESYEDCPYYEQLQYAFDTRLQILFTYCLGGDTRLALKTIDDFHRSRLPEGILQSRYPSNGPQVIPTFSISWISMLLDYYDQTGDTSVLWNYRFTAEAVIHWFRQKKNADGFVESLGYWNYIDWPHEWNDNSGAPHAVRHGPSTIQNFMYVYGLRELARIMTILGFEDLAEYYSTEETRLRALLLDRCYDEKRGLFREGPRYSAEYTQHAQVWAVITRTVSGDESAALMRRTLSDPDLIKCTFPSKFYLFRALEAAGLYEETESLWDDWKRLLDLDLTTIPETPYDTVRSDCHAWSSLLLYEYPSKILGVSPREPGYGVINIKPLGLYMGSAGGTVSTPAGPVNIAWEYRNNVFTINGAVPRNGQATLVLPDSSRHNLGEGSFSYRIDYPAP
ncbi:MAG: hypothetical protein LBF95_02095 [Treponema sp.]|jgi:hypothetical protein|nr:hypothetical protein [Treponema sp.]